MTFVPAKTRHLLPEAAADAAIERALARMEPGWLLLCGCAFPDLQGRMVRVDYACLHPRIGVALIDLAPRSTSDAHDRLRQRLDAQGFAASHGAIPPIVYRVIARSQLGRLADSLSWAFDAEAPAAWAARSAGWVEALRDALSPQPPGPASSAPGAPPGRAPQRPVSPANAAGALRRLSVPALAGGGGMPSAHRAGQRALLGFWLVVLGGAGSVALVLDHLGPPEEIAAARRGSVDTLPMASAAPRREAGPGTLVAAPPRLALLAANAVDPVPVEPPAGSARGVAEASAEVAADSAAAMPRTVPARFDGAPPGSGAAGNDASGAADRDAADGSVPQRDPGAETGDSSASTGAVMDPALPAAIRIDLDAAQAAGSATPAGAMPPTPHVEPAAAPPGIADLVGADPATAVAAEPAMATGQPNATAAPAMPSAMTVAPAAIGGEAAVADSLVTPAAEPAMPARPGGVPSEAAAADRPAAPAPETVSANHPAMPASEPASLERTDAPMPAPLDASNSAAPAPNLEHPAPPSPSIANAAVPTNLAPAAEASEPAQRQPPVSVAAPPSRQSTPEGAVAAGPDSPADPRPEAERGSATSDAMPPGLHPAPDRTGVPGTPAPVEPSVAAAGAASPADGEAVPEPPALAETGVAAADTPPPADSTTATSDPMPPEPGVAAPALAAQPASPPEGAAAPEPPSEQAHGRETTAAGAARSDKGSAEPGAAALAGRVVTVAGANVRAAPSGSAPVVGAVGSGTRLRVFAQFGGWLQLGDVTPWGWVHQSRIDEPSPPPGPSDSLAAIAPPAVPPGAAPALATPPPDPLPLPPAEQSAAGLAAAVAQAGGAAPAVPQPAAPAPGAMGQTVAPAAAAPAAVAAALPAPRPPAAPPQARPAVANPALLAALLDRGRAMLGLGDVSAARLLFERAAENGSAAAAIEAGRTYDPAVLAAIGARGIRPDPAAAIAWYRRAVTLGERESAEAALRRLGAEPRPVDASGANR